MGQFGLDDAPAALGGHRQGFLAEHRLAGGDGCQHEFLVAGAPGRDQHRLHLGRADQGMAVCMDFSLQLQVVDHPRRLLPIDVGHGHDPTALQGLAATPDVILADGPGPDNA